MEIFSKIFDFFANREIKISSKFRMVLFVIIIIYLTDNILGFSFYYNTNQKINEISIINELLKDSTFSSDEKIQLDSLRHLVLLRKSFSDRISLFVNGIFNQDKHPSAITNTSNIKSISPSNIDLTADNTIQNNNTATGIATAAETITNNTIRTVPIRNNLLFLISCSWSFLLVILISPTMLFVVKSKLSQRFISMFSFIFIFLASSAFHYWLFGFVPRFGNTWTWNYVFNAIMQIVMLFIYYYITKCFSNISKKIN